MFAAMSKPGAAFLTDAGGKICTWNSACEDLFGFSSADVLHQSVAVLLAPASRGEFEQRWPEVASLRAAALRLQLIRADGTTAAATLALHPQADGVGPFKGSVLCALEAVAESEAEQVGHTPLDAIVNLFPGTFYVVNGAGRLVLWNRNLEKVVEMTPQEVAATPVLDMFGGGDRQVIERKIAEVFAGAEVLVEADVISKSGKTTPFLLCGTRIDNHDTAYLYGVGVDLSSHRQHEEQLRLRDRALHAASNGIVITRCVGTDHPIEYVNPAFERITGYKAREVIGRDPRFMAAPGLDVHERATLRTATDECREINVVFRNRRKNGELFWNDLSVTPVRDANGKFTHFIGVINDVTAIKQRTVHLEHEVNHDSLTGLANRNLLWDRLGHALQLAQRNKSLVATVLIDLDDFKHINDSAGHEAGDEVLKVVAKRLLASVRESDTVARLSGDEFVLVLVDQPSLHYTVSMIERVRAHMAETVAFGGKQIPVRASMGVSMYPHDGASVIDLVRAADVAMYSAKSSGSDDVHFFSEDMKSTTEAKQRLTHDMREALERDQMFLLYQPRVNLATGRVEGVEVLLRWRHPEQGVLLPASFLADAEENGMIVPFGNWVMDQACAFLMLLKARGYGALPVTVNASQREYSQHDYVAHVGARLQRLQLAPECLEIDMRQDGLLRNPELGREVARQMGALGIRLSVDAFGEGLADLGFLQELPVAHLKIAPSVMEAMAIDPGDGAMAKTLIDIAHNLDIAVIGEGVETAVQMEFLKANGCDEMQGRYFSEPLSADALLRLLGAHAVA